MSIHRCNWYRGLIVKDECPSDLGRWDLATVPTHQEEGRPIDASLPQIASAVLDDPNFASCASLVPVVALAERAGLHRVIREHVRVSGAAGSNPVTRVVALVAGMIAGADRCDLPVTSARSRRATYSSAVLHFAHWSL